MIASLTPEQRDTLRARLVRAASAGSDMDGLREIEDALRRMDGPAYGTCAECAAALPWIRLDAHPEATRCVRCETERQRRRAQG